MKGIGRVGWTRNKKGYIITIPRDVALDSRFPFKRGDQVIVEIDPENMRLIISRL